MASAPTTGPSLAQTTRQRACSPTHIPTSCNLRQQGLLCPPWPLCHSNHKMGGFFTHHHPPILRFETHTFIPTAIHFVTRNTMWWCFFATYHPSCHVLSNRGASWPPPATPSV